MRLFCSLLLLLCAHWATGFNPNELKPCFERYDGFKIVNAIPFHSEWRMKVEEWCLEFCVRASSRCVSIVYDKHSHICHYFSVNGIEEEKITKHPRMVYFQIAEKQCAERMQNKIEQEEEMRREQFEQQQQQASSTSIAQSLETNKMSTDQPTQSVNDKNQQPTTLEPTNTSSETSENEFSMTSQMEHVETTTIMEEKASFPIRPSEESEQTSQTEEMTTAKMDETQPKEEEEFDGDPMNFVRRFQFEKEGVDTTNDSLFPMQPDKVVVLTTTEEMPITNTPQIETTFEETTPLESSTMTIVEPTTIELEPATTTEQITTSTQEQPTSEVPKLPKMIDPMSNLADNAAAIVPVMNGFKAVRRPLPTKTSLNVEKKEPEMIEVRRSPQRFTPSESMTDHPKYTGRRPVAQKFDSEPEPTVLQADDDETMLADNVPVIDDCSNGMQEIWLAVENSQVNSTVRTSVIKIATQPTECMEACQTLFIGKHPCDSFTFIEPAKRCIFHSSHSGFHVKPSALNDFSTRAFRRFCYPESLSPFSDCAEFLAFRDYTLDISPREIFENLPLGNEGLSACIELCVLSNEFRCKSATFNTKNGTCMIFDEHSLTKPSNFKANTDPNRMYFENGCIEMKIPDSALQQSKVQRVQPTLLDFRKLSMH